MNYRIQKVSFLVAREAGAPPLGRLLLTEPKEAARVAREMLPDDGKEHVGAFYLDAQNRLVAYHEVSTGTLTASLVTAREALGPALRLVGVASVILVHNHPSGDPTPSQDDLSLTKALGEAAKILGLTLHDHIVVGSGSDAFVSLAQRGII